MLNRDKEWLLQEKYGGVPTPEYEVDIERLATGEPVAYVIGWQPFLGLRVYLDSKPLIPRPETEWWTEELIHKIIAAAPNTRFLDLCAGSGAIGCAVLSRVPNARVYFGEIDATHEATIRKNISENALNAARTEIRVGDLFTPFHNMTFDFIAINPPYIPSGRVLEPSVTKHEPAQALYSGPDGLELIRKIAVELPHHLSEGGGAWIECDSAHAEAACALFTKQGLATELRADQYGVPRLIIASRTGSKE